MLTLKYQKTGAACFVSHIETLRQISRILRRAQIPARYSQGFNPHALVFFSPPSPLGIRSEAEYVSIDTDMPPEEALQAYNDNVPDNIKALRAYRLDKNPNLQGIITAADYVFPICGESFADLSESGLTVTYVKGGREITENVKDKIIAVEKDGERLKLRLAAGNVNLRPDIVLRALDAGASAASIVKTAQYVSESGCLTNADDYLERLSLK